MFSAVMFQANFSRLYYGIFRLTSFYSLPQMNVYTYETSQKTSVTTCALVMVLGAHSLGPTNSQGTAVPDEKASTHVQLPSYSAKIKTLST